MQAARQGRGVVAGHGTGLKQLPEINAFAAARLELGRRCLQNQNVERRT
jgi:hypothetical protein